MNDLRWDDSQQERLTRLIDEWIAEELASTSAFLSVEKVEPARWRIRVRGEEREVITVWWWLRDYTLWSETYFIPTPENPSASFFEGLLRWNAGLYGVTFALGEENAVYLVGRCPWTAVSRAELDRLFGATYGAVERFFPLALQAAGFR